MALISTADKNKLYLHVKHELGYPLRPFEITDEMMDSYLEMVIEDYSSLVNSWLIHQQWVGIEGMETEGNNFMNVFLSKSNSYIESFTVAYSKQIGMSTNGPALNNYELKRDFIEIIENTQHYVIPKNREINELLWLTPGSLNAGLIDPFAIGGSWGAGLLGFNIYNRNMQSVSPMYSTLLAAQDISTKRRILQSELTFKISSLASGEKLLHLYPLPGSRNEIGLKHLNGSKVWYWYYDTTNLDRDKCLEDNPDIVRLPSDPPFKTLRWEKINDTGKQQIRNLLISKTKLAISGVRGFYSGTLGSENMQLTMDYRHLGDEGAKLKEETEKNILDLLEKIKISNLVEERAKIAENVNKAMSYQPPKYPIIPI